MKILSRNKYIEKELTLEYSTPLRHINPGFNFSIMAFHNCSNTLIFDMKGLPMLGKIMGQIMSTGMPTTKSVLLYFNSISLSNVIFV